MYKTSQRGNGMGGVHHRQDAHRLYLIPKMDEIEHVKKPSDDEHVKKPSDDDRPSKCDKVTIKMISPAQATLERAESEAKHRKKEENELQPMTKHLFTKVNCTAPLLELLKKNWINCLT